MRNSTMQELHLHIIDIFITKYVMMKYKQKKTTQLFYEKDKNHKKINFLIIKNTNFQRQKSI